MLGQSLVTTTRVSRRAARAWPGEVLDLGQAWTDLTGLPFVYARWTARRGLADPDARSLALLLDEAARAGIPRRQELARRFAAARGEDEAAAALYVERHVRFEIGPREEEGLARFARLVLAEEATPLPETPRA